MSTCVQVIDAYSKLQEDVNNHVVNCGTSVTKQIFQLITSLYAESQLTTSNSKAFIENLNTIYSTQVAYIVEGFGSFLQIAAADFQLFEIDMKTGQISMDSVNTTTVIGTLC